MTGQILGGQSPSAAAAYQIMIYFAIACSSCLTAMFLACIVTARMFDLRHQAFIPWRLIPGLKTLKKSDATSIISEQPANPQPHSKLGVLGKSGSSDKTCEPLLKVKGLTVESTKLHVPLLEINAGDRIGIRGRSGAGKTQLFRTIARLDPVSAAQDETIVRVNNIMSLDGQSWNDIPPVHWRSQVMWVSQDRPTLSGTPREFYTQILNYRSHQQLSEQNNGLQKSSPMDIAQDWNLSANTWDLPWNDISGGEAQRLSLAIALSLEPKVLLLDEPTASCDDETTRKIENTLIERKATVLMVSHSTEQLRRFTINTIDLSQTHNMEQ